MVALHPDAVLHDLSPWFIGVAVSLLVLAAMGDIAARIIPNRLCLGVACMGVLLRLGDGHLPLALLVAVTVFAVLSIFFMRGWLGGGDVKLLSACVLLVTPALAPSVIVVISLAGALLALLYLVLGRLLPAPGPRPRLRISRILRIEQFRIKRGGPLPYGVGIALGSILVLLKGPA